MRIVSLLPAATEIVSALGLDAMLVGVSHDSDWPPSVVARLPVLNTVSIDTQAMTSREIDAAASGGHQGASLYHVDADLLRSLRPDLVLTQEICEVCAVSRRDVELASQTLGYTPRILSLSPVTLEQMLDDIELVARTVAEADGAVEPATSTRSHAELLASTASRATRPKRAPLVRQLRARLHAVGQRTAGLRRPRVFCMEWLDPPFTAGHWVPEMVDLAGGRDELGTAAGPSRRIEWPEVVAYAPEVIVLMPCSLDLERVAAEFPLLLQLAGWRRLPAVQTGQVYAGHTHLFSRSGPRLVDGAETLARMLHPEVFPQTLPPGQALRISTSGDHLEPVRVSQWRCTHRSGGESCCWTLFGRPSRLVGDG